MERSNLILAAVLTAAGLLAAGQAEAHAHLLKALPADGATTASPSKLQLDFSEALEPKFSTVTLTTAAGSPVAAASQVAKNRKTIVATPKAPLAAGGYHVNWRVVSADGHKMQGDYAFSVK